MLVALGLTLDFEIDENVDFMEIPNMQGPSMSCSQAWPEDDERKNVYAFVWGPFEPNQLIGVPEYLAVTHSSGGAKPQRPKLKVEEDEDGIWLSALFTRSLAAHTWIRLEDHPTPSQKHLKPKAARQRAAYGGYGLCG